MNRFERAAVLAGAVALGGVAAEVAPDHTAEARSRVSIDSPADFTPIRERIIKCSTRDGKWVALAQGDRVTLRASAAVIPSDASVGGKPQMDNDADTATTFAVRSKNGDPKNWTIDANYSGSMFVLPCDSSAKDFYNAVGREVVVLDRMQGANDPLKRVNFNVVEK